ncbi:ectoine/hydroxyectoine ABC transporter substrate-binding protein EhuB [Aquamicrobium sp. LC103]|nr:ectoine/hydroxyectoine ABC transporter substrate-binding protein EhuB [Aquamicrobium sp. LC103]
MKNAKRALISGFIAYAMLAATTVQSEAESTRENIFSSGKITIGIHNQAPWGFRGPDGEATGFHPDLIRSAFKPLGVTEIEFIISDFGALIPGLLAQRIDVVASGLAVTPARCEQVAFSEPDLAIGDALIVKEGNPHNLHSYADISANPNVLIGGSRGSANMGNAIASGIPTPQIQQFQNTEASVSAIMAGRVQAVTFSTATVVSVLSDPKITGLERATPFQGFVKPNGLPAANYAAIAFRKNDLDLRDAYNERLAALKADGTLTAIMEKYGFTTEEEAPDFIVTAKLCSGEQ